jgi:hypothetical protein
MEMRVKFERTGGFAGIRLTTTADTENLSSDDAARLRQLVAGASFFELPETIAPQKAQPDRFQYRVTIEDDSRVHTVTVSETALPQSMRPLTDFLARQTHG